MTEQQTPVMTPPAAPPAAPTGPKKKRKGRGKTIAGILIVAAIAIALVVLVWYFVFREDGSKGEVMTDFVTRGSIQSMVEGSGTTKAKDSATVTPGSGTILELFVQEGDQVTAGQQLYRMDDTTARDAVTEAQKSVDNCNKELQAVYDKIAELSITAPHAGNLREVADLKVGDTVNEGDTIATLVNDTKLRLSLYYSYAYEGDIKVGQTAQISIPAIMAPVTGKVEQINKVRFVSPEGATHFEVVLVLDNPGTLAEGMDASAGLTAADGTPIYPYQNGKLEYYESTKITAKATGPVERVSLLDYGDVKAGQLLVQLGAKDTDEEIASKENALKAAQEKLEEATKELEKYNAVAPIDGTVLQCSLTEGQEVSSGQGITIAAGYLLDDHRNSGGRAQRPLHQGRYDGGHQPVRHALRGHRGERIHDRLRRERRGLHSRRCHRGQLRRQHDPRYLRRILLRGQRVGGLPHRPRPGRQVCQLRQRPAPRKPGCRSLRRNG